jgi:ornithine decarboxylase
VATSGEIKVLRQAKVDPKKCIHTHPIKTDAEIREAIRFGIQTFVVDNIEEAAKFRRYRQKVQLLIRLSFPAKDAVCDLSRKFGLSPEQVPDAWAQIRAMSIKVAGFSFHVGSQTPSSAMTVHAIEVVRQLCREAPAEALAEVQILDIGGGFPVQYTDPVLSIDEYAAPIRKALEGLPAAVRVLAEPGRFIAAPAGVVITTVVGRAMRNGRRWLYLDDGVYGCFNGRLFDHARYPITAVGGSTELEPVVLAGPTCDSIDVIESDLSLPVLEIGEHIVGHVMGAYTQASATEFNSYPKPKVLILDQPHAYIA